MNGQYEVLNPWAQADPVPLRGISSRVTDFTDKTIGLFIGSKTAAAPIQIVVEKKLRERFATLKFSRFHFGENLEVAETKDKARFEEWLKGIDAAVTAVGD